MSGHVGHDGMGGYYTKPFEADTFRAAAYKYYNLQPETCFQRSSRKLHILYLPRARFSDGRNVLNEKEMEEMIGELSVFFFFCLYCRITIRMNLPLFIQLV